MGVTDKSFHVKLNANNFHLFIFIFINLEFGKKIGANYKFDVGP